MALFNNNSKKAEEINNLAEKIYYDAKLSFQELITLTDEKIKLLRKININVYTENLTDFINLFIQIQNPTQLNNNLIFGKLGDQLNFQNFSDEVFYITSIIKHFDLLTGSELSDTSLSCSFTTIIENLVNNNNLSYKTGSFLYEFRMEHFVIARSGLSYLPSVAITNLLGLGKNYELDMAYSNLERAKTAVTEIESNGVMIASIQHRVDEIIKIIESLNFYLTVYNKQLLAVINTDCNYNSYSDYQKNFINNWCELASTLKMLCDVVILDKDNKITQKSDYVLAVAKKLCYELSGEQ